MAEQDIDIAVAAGQPQKYEVDGEAIWNHSLKDQIAAAKFIAAKRASRNPFGAISRIKISTQGAED